MLYVIEHLDVDMGAWPVHEYTRAQEVVGEGKLLVTNCSDEHKKDFMDHGENVFRDEMFTTVSINALAESDKARDECKIEALKNLDFKRVAVLDEKGERCLEPADADKFDAVIFGGILGDDPPMDISAILRKLTFQGATVLHLGPIQMPTDTAVHVTKMIVEDGKTLDEIPFKDSPEFVFSKNERVVLPFRYVADGSGEALLSPPIVELLKKDFVEDADNLW
eukprot:Clim_evm11s26 gene=Clim_evmTU11s26